MQTLHGVGDVRTSQLPGLAGPVAGAVWVDALIWPSNSAACLSASNDKSGVRACQSAPNGQCAATSSSKGFAPEMLTTL